ncbi:MAG: hypothetical protein ACTHOC_01305, partial [Luteimonas sp.]
RDGRPSHLARGFVPGGSGDVNVTRIARGGASAPALASTTVRATAKALPAGYERFFASWAGAVRFLCRQDTAIVAVDGDGRIAQAGISLPIDLDTVVPLQSTETRGAGFLEAVGATGEPFCFAVPKVRFEVLWERMLPRLG